MRPETAAAETVAVAVLVPSLAVNTTQATCLPPEALRWNAATSASSAFPTTRRCGMIQLATGLGLVSAELLVTPAIVSVE